MSQDSPETDTSDDRRRSAAGLTARALICVSLIIMCAAVLIHRFVGLTEAALVSSACFVFFFLIGQHLIGWRERGLMTAGIVLVAIALLTHAAPEELIRTSLERAAFLATFMILLALLRVGAAQSSAVLALGEYLTRQPPGRRYIAIHSGSHVMGVLLNFGALSLIGPLIKRGVDATRNAEPAAAAAREERQLSALVRGFSWMIAWSPTAVTQALIPVVVIGAEPVVLAGMGALVALALFPVAWLNDRIVGCRARQQLAREGAVLSAHRPRFPRAAVRRFGLVCLSLVISTAIVVLATEVIVIVALMLMAPVVSVAWLWIQAKGSAMSSGASFRNRIGHVVTRSIPGSMPEALTLATGGFCGLMLAGLLDPATVTRWLQLTSLPKEATYLLAVAIVPLLSNIAIPPILAVTFFGSILISMPQLALDPTLLGFSFVMGWVLNLTGSPFGAAALVLGRATGVAGTTITWRWNGPFTLASFAVIAAFLFALGA